MKTHIEVGHYDSDPSKIELSFYENKGRKGTAEPHNLIPLYSHKFTAKEALAIGSALIAHATRELLKQKEDKAATDAIISRYRAR